MPRYSLFLLSLLLGCHSFPFHSDSEADANQPLLIGHWRWTESDGGLAYRKLTPETEQYQQTLVITPDSLFTIYRNDSVSFQGHFHLVRDKSIYADSITWLIRFDNRSVDLSFDVNAFSLTLYDQCYDCFTSRYRRMY